MTGFDLCQLTKAVAEHGVVTRIVIAAHAGSAPRETGTSMLVWQDGMSGTIGGGALEFEAIAKANDMLNKRTGAARAAARAMVFKMPLGPALGQCCGGSVTLVIETFDAEVLQTIPTDQPNVRPISETTDTIPLSIQRRLNQVRAQGLPVETELTQGWLIEPLIQPNRQLWLYGAGHVGRAIVETLDGLPFDVTWIDTDLNRFPDQMPSNATPLVAKNPGDIVRHAPPQAEHLVLTYSHAFDLDICHRILNHTFTSLGVIGSDTKKKRFQKRLAALGHNPQQIARMICPIGRRALGKLPKAIAVGIAADLMETEAITASRKEA